MTDLDVYLSAITRRLDGIRGIRRLTLPFRSHYARKYIESPDRFVTINDYAGNIRMILDRSAYLGGSLYWQRYHHVGEIRYLFKNLTSEMTFADVGANQGEFALVAAKLASAGQVLAFEPENRMFELLEKNVRLNDYQNVTLFKLGLGSENSASKIYTSTETALHHGWHEGLFTSYQDDTRAEFVQDIEIRRLDDVLAEIEVERIDYMKVDVEGAELPVLQGAIESLRRFRPKVLLEINETTFKAAGYSAIEILEFMTKLDYRFFSILRNGKIREEETQKIISNPRTFNILCQPA